MLLINNMVLIDGVLIPAVIVWKHGICKREICASPLMYADWLTTEANVGFVAHW